MKQDIKIPQQTTTENQWKRRKNTTASYTRSGVLKASCNCLCTLGSNVKPLHARADHTNTRLHTRSQTHVDAATLAHIYRQTNPQPQPKHLSVIRIVLYSLLEL